MVAHWARSLARRRPACEPLGAKAWGRLGVQAPPRCHAGQPPVVSDANPIVCSQVGWGAVADCCAVPCRDLPCSALSSLTARSTAAAWLHWAGLHQLRCVGVSGDAGAGRCTAAIRCLLAPKLSKPAAPGRPAWVHMAMAGGWRFAVGWSAHYQLPLGRGPIGGHAELPAQASCHRRPGVELLKLCHSHSGCARKHGKVPFPCLPLR